MATPSASPAPTAEARADRDAARRNWLMSVPVLLVMGLCATLPMLVMVVYSFLTPGKYGNVEWAFSPDGWIGLVLTRDIFDGTFGWADAHLTILWRTIRLSLLTTLLCFAVGFPTAWFIATRPARSRAFWLFLITIPFWTNLLIRTFAINELIRNEGLINTILLKLGVIATPIQMIYSDGAMLAGMVYVYLPLMVLPLFAVMDRFDMRLLEAGYDLYASRWQILTRILLPILRPGIVAGCILVFIPVARGLCHSACARRRQEHDGRQPDRAAVRSGPELAARGRACRLSGADRLRRDDPVCPPHQPRACGMKRFSITGLPGFTPIADHLLRASLSADHDHRRLQLQRREGDERMGRAVAALVPRRLGKRGRPDRRPSAA